MIHTKCNKWVLCPICHNKTRTKVNDNTVLKNFPLYCPKCKQESLINVENLSVSVVDKTDNQ